MKKEKKNKKIKKNLSSSSAIAHNNKFFIRSDLKKGNVLKRSIKYGLKSSLVYDDRFLDYSSNLTRDLGYYGSLDEPMYLTSQYYSVIGPAPKFYIVALRCSPILILLF